MNVANYKNLLFNTIALVLFVFIFLNNVNHILHKSVFIEVEKSTKIVPKSESNNKLYSFTSKDPKLIFSDRLTSFETYNNYLNRQCEITGSFEDRKKVRWVFMKAFFEIYNFFEKMHKALPFYFHIIFFSLLLFLSYYISFKIFPVDEKYKYLFLFYVAFIFQHSLSEYQFSVIEMFFLTLSLYASKSKNFVLFLFSVTFATLNRESGILLSLTWLIFNSDFKKIIYAGAIVSSIFVVLNLDILNCIINPSYFLPTEYQQGQFNFQDIGKEISYLSATKVILKNYLIPFGFCFYVYLSSYEKNKIILLLISMYLLMFLVATPAEHISVRLILLPIIIMLLYFRKEKKI